MNRFALFATAVATMFALLHGTPAQALNAKSWVSRAGSDSNPCTLAMPCATLQHAHDATASGGEISILDPGDYAGLFISQAISISHDRAGEATIGSVGSVGIIISAGVGNVVSLRGLVFDGMGSSGPAGIDFNLASALHIQNCVFRNYESAVVGYGIRLFPAAHTSQLFVSDTIIFNNGSAAGSGGILIAPEGTASVNAVLDRVRLENNVEGLSIDTRSATGGAGVHVIVRDSVMSGNAANGIHVHTTAGKPPAFAFVERSSIVDNVGAGILADGPGATVVVGSSTISRNAAGVSTMNSGQLISYGDNQNNNNIGAEGSATSTYTRF
jgi:hypothetical protein